MLIRAGELKSLMEAAGNPLAAADRVCEAIHEAVKAKKVDPLSEQFAREVSIKSIAEAVCGRDWVESLVRRGGPLIAEGVSAVNSSAFANIIGQIAHSMVNAAFGRSGLAELNIVPTVPTPFNGEKIPRLANISPDGSTVTEGQEAPLTGFGESWVTTPSTQRDALRIGLTREAVIFDRTGQLQSQARSVGEAIAQRKAIKILRVIAGIDNTFSEDGTTTNTYLTSGARTNARSSAALADWSSIDGAMQLWTKMTDPATGYPIVIPGTGAVLLVPPALAMIGNRILTATTVRTTTNTATQETEWGNPLAGQFTVVASSLMRWLIRNPGGQNDAVSDGRWFFGYPSKAFAYMENWPLTVEVAGPQHADVFNRDLVGMYKATERGVCAVIDPRYIVRNDA